MTYRLKFNALDHNLDHVHKDRWPDHDAYYFLAHGPLILTAGGALGEGKERWQVKGRLIRGTMLKAAGLESGVLDTFLAWPKIKQHVIPQAYDRDLKIRELIYAGMYIEFKAPGKTLSEEQELFISIVQPLGYKCVTCFAAAEAIREIEEYLR